MGESLHEASDTLTILNAVLDYRFGALAESRTLDDVDEASILDHEVMGAGWDRMLASLRMHAAYVDRFRALYGRDRGREQVLGAVANIQRSLVTPSSLSDRYLDCQKDTSTQDEAHGYQLFQEFGCLSWHQGRNIGGKLVEKFGMFAQLKALEEAEERKVRLGREGITGQEQDRFVFWVPSLSNLAMTAPYQHDGSVDILKEAAGIMGGSQLSREFD